MEEATQCLGAHATGRTEPPVLSPSSLVAWVLGEEHMILLSLRAFGC